MDSPPSNPDAEKAILGSILCDGNAIFEKTVAWIRDANAFYSTMNRNIWNIMSGLYKERIPIDVITVVNDYRKKYGETNSETAYYITGLMELVPTSSNVEQYARIVWEKFIQRKTAESAYNLYKSSGKADDLDLILEDHSKLISELKDLRPTRRKDTDLIITEAIEVLKSDGNIIPYGIDVLDWPAGGMTRKEVSVLAGRTGHGKTTLMLNIIKSLIEQNYKVMLFNREMANSTTINKLIVMESNGLIYENIRKGAISGTVAERVEKIAKLMKFKYRNLIMYDNIRSLDETMIEISRYKPDVVVDDYIQLVRVPGQRERRFEVEKIMQEYFWIAKHENCTALLLSQISREIERRIDPIPRLSDLSESAAIEQVAESVMFVFYGYKFNSEKYDKYQSMIVSSKTRYGHTGRFDVGFNGDRCKFYFSRNEAEKGK